MPVQEHETVTTGPHTPVSNQLDIASEVDGELTGPPSVGADEQQAAAGTEVEDVPGHESLAFASGLEITFSLPLSQLPDIGEASFGTPPDRQETSTGPMTGRRSRTPTSIRGAPSRRCSSLRPTIPCGSGRAGSSAHTPC